MTSAIARLCGARAALRGCSLEESSFLDIFQLMFAIEFNMRMYCRNE